MSARPEIFCLHCEAPCARHAILCPACAAAITPSLPAPDSQPSPPRPWTPFDCPHCLNRRREGQITCGPCWREVPEPLRDAWLRVDSIEAEGRAVRAILKHFGRDTSQVCGRSRFPATYLDPADLRELLEASPYFNHDPRAGARRWKCQGCDRSNVRDSESLCQSCTARLPHQLRRAWQNAGSEEDGPEWDAVAAWLEANKRETVCV